MSKPTRNDTLIQLAVIGAAQGLHGEVRVKAFTSDPMALGDYGPLKARDGRVFTVRRLRPVKNVVVARFAEVTDRNAAEALNGTALFVDRAALPAELDEEEYYHADLIGLAAVDETGASLGTIGALHNFGAGDILEITLVDGGSALVPFTRAAVTSVDLAAKLARFDRAAAGLLDEEADGDPDGEAPSGDGN
ncbi:ribosome maturation factor RimM [Nitratireductor soli]|uniref:ribosome maturation factor RimM n=1 Tax=Nitratireductor soli TaxID=1670619 RepID=UPI00065DC28C|nr:ribosome maturation factor RimM [Nitratireductor soli]